MSPSPAERTPSQAPLARWSPAAVLATWFGIGRLPVAPGTWGSLAALPFAWVLAASGGAVALGLATALVLAAGIWASGRYAAAGRVKDPGAIVIDEVAGQWLTLVLVPTDWMLYAIGFALFRVMDIFKPWPANWIDRRVPGGAGIMLDDIAAGLYAGAMLYFVARFLS